MTVVADTFDCSTLTLTQLGLIEAACAAADFPWAIIKPGLRAQTGRELIPVGFADLSRFSAQVAGESAHTHSHPAPDAHAHDDPEAFHVVEHRGRPLGLAWYSGKVDVEATLESQPVLAQEVFLAEAAHMIDFFYMTPQMRERIFDLFHGSDDDPTAGDTPEHGHGWFEETGNNDYWSWAGEGFMGAFITAYTDLDPTLGGFAHTIDEAQGQQLREILRPLLHTANARSRIVHDEHAGTWTKTSRVFASLNEAVAAGYRPCRTCKPA